MFLRIHGRKMLLLYCSVKDHLISRKEIGGYKIWLQNNYEDIIAKMREAVQGNMYFKNKHLHTWKHILLLSLSWKSRSFYKPNWRIFKNKVLISNCYLDSLTIKEERVKRELQTDFVMYSALSENCFDRSP